MATRVGIVSVGLTKLSHARHDVNTEELSYEAVKQVMQETGLSFNKEGDIDHKVIVCDDLWEAETLSDIKLHNILGGHMGDCNKVPQDATQALLYSAAHIMSGHVDTVIVLATIKMSPAVSRNEVPNYGFDPLYMRGIGIDHISAAALQARTYMQTYSITREQCAKAVVKSRKNAKNNPYANESGDITVDDVLRAKMMASPLGELDVFPVTDGAVAIILACEEKAKKLAKKPVWINGMGTYRDRYHLGSRNLAVSESLEKAAQQAYKMTGITDPRKEIDFVEMGAEYSYQELLWSEGLGLCARGEGGKLIDSGATQVNGDIPIDPSGGMLSGYPTFVAGAASTAQAVLQLTGGAGAAQLDKADVALVHGVSGPCGQLQTVLVLGK